MMILCGGIPTAKDRQEIDRARYWLWCCSLIFPNRDQTDQMMNEALSFYKGFFEVLDRKKSNG